MSNKKERLPHIRVTTRFKDLEDLDRYRFLDRVDASNLDTLSFRRSQIPDLAITDSASQSRENAGVVPS